MLKPLSLCRLLVLVYRDKYNRLTVDQASLAPQTTNIQSDTEQSPLLS